MVTRAECPLRPDDVMVEDAFMQNAVAYAARRPAANPFRVGGCLFRRLRVARASQPVDSVDCRSLTAPGRFRSLPRMAKKTHGLSVSKERGVHASHYAKVMLGQIFGNCKCDCA